MPTKEVCYIYLSSLLPWTKASMAAPMRKESVLYVLLSKPIYDMDIEKTSIHLTWYLVTGVPLEWKKKVLGQRGLTDINDFSDNTGQIMLLFVDYKFMSDPLPSWSFFGWLRSMLQIIWRNEMGTSVGCLFVGPGNDYLNLDRCCRERCLF